MLGPLFCWVRVRRPVGEKGELAGDAQRASPWSSNFLGNHVISDAHEWNNGIPIGPIYYLAKPQQSERTLLNQRGNKTLSDFAESAGQKVLLWLVDKDFFMIKKRFIWYIYSNAVETHCLRKIVEKKIISVIATGGSEARRCDSPADPRLCRRAIFVSAVVLFPVLFCAGKRRQ